MLTRRQYIEYKLKYIQKVASDPNESTEMSRSEALASKSSLLTELSSLQGAIEVAIRDYEQQFGEKFVRPTTSSTPGSGTVSTPTQEPNPNRPSRPAPQIHYESPGLK
jgi:hypothetical protein